MLLKLKSTIDTSESSKVMSYLAIVYMFNSSSPTDMQATNNLFGGCISVWEKEEEE